MPLSTLHNFAIRGIASAVPAGVRLAADSCFPAEEALRISASLGVKERRVAGRHTCASDLCFAAAERLLGELNWRRDSVDALIFVSQTPDHILPPTACILQERLKLSKRCAAFDVNLGCSGYVYGLWLAGSLIASGAVRRVLLLAGDTITRLCDPADRSVALLFGDAGSATALEHDPASAPAFFNLGSDGAGAGHLCVSGGGFRQTAGARAGAGDKHLQMNGAEIFAFTLREVPAMIRGVLDAAAWPIESADAFVFHQANAFLLQHLIKKLKLPPEKVPMALEKYGNTSVASIPVAITHGLRPILTQRPAKLLLAGFGVGLSWGAVAMGAGPLVLADMIEVPEPP
ncbi:MAG TPA: ketoacyl-ACP synthase III [Tepidisphaeraceae bacterium]|jgi:3-oxoacyl-[acyl-carrier-protein] synthase-3